jgi:hypothetical protein
MIRLLFFNYFATHTIFMQFEAWLVSNRSFKLLKSNNL